MTDAPETPSAPRRRPGRPPKQRPPAPTLDEAPERPEKRAEDPREAMARAKERAQQIIENFDGTEVAVDQFAIPPQPPGWTYEWKFKTCYNQEDPARMNQYRRTGWSEVPASRHPEMMPIGYTGLEIERKGLVLMERPQEITDRFKERDKRLAREQVRVKEEQLNSAPQGQFDRKNKDQPLARISKGYEPMPIPEK